MAAVLCFASGTMLRLAAENSQPHWSIVPSPNATGQQFSGITCVSASDCWAVGYYTTRTYQQDTATARTLIEHWNGTSWTLIPSPNTDPNFPNKLNAVVCASSSNCWAVGYSIVFSASSPPQNLTLVEHWDGQAWSIVTSPNPGSRFNRLLAVTCASSSDCWAVGFQTFGSQTSSGAHLALTEHWDGNSWTVVTVPSPTPSDLNGVTCVSSSDCWAVGRTTSSPEQAVTQHWDGHSWSIVTSANLGNTVDLYLASVSCTSASNCWAVGFSSDENTEVPQTLIQHWDGTNWLIVAAPNTSATAANQLYGVSCSSAVNCWAVGYATPNTQLQLQQPLIAHWNGSSWQFTATPDPTSHSRAAEAFFAVTCKSDAACWAAGNSDGQHTLAERWDGSWLYSSSPDAAGGGIEDSFQSVACSSNVDCWAVGAEFDGVDQFFAHWNGMSWKRFPAPIVALSTYSGLADVTCTSSTSCWTVGNYDGPTSYLPLIEHWDGSAWSKIAAPSASGNNFLQSVKCNSASDCWTVGFVENAGDPNPYTWSPLIEHWNGSSWSIVFSPDDHVAVNELYGLSCTSVSDCWAVGFSDNNDPNASAPRALIEHWNGTSWTLVSSPSIAPFMYLYSAACTSAAQCWAVGQSEDGTGEVRSLIERWDGQFWSIVTPTGLPDGNHSLNGVTCSSASNCWAVGQTQGFASSPLTIHWDGTNWTVVASDRPPGATTTLHSVTCASDAVCWTAGNYQAGSPNAPSIHQTLIERLVIPPNANITSVAHPAGHFIIAGRTNVPNSTVTITSTLNLLTPFSNPQSVGTDATGAFRLDDATAAQTEFYQVRFRSRPSSKSRTDD